MASWLFACMTTLTGGGPVHTRISGLFMACCEMRRRDDFHRGCVGHSHRNPRDSLHRSCHCSRGGYGILASIRSGWGPRVSGLNRSLGQHHFSSLSTIKAGCPKWWALEKVTKRLSIWPFWYIKCLGCRNEGVAWFMFNFGRWCLHVWSWKQIPNIDVYPTSKLMLLF